MFDFYAAKCGCRQKYQAGQNLETGGGDERSRYLISLVHNTIAGAPAAQAAIAVNSEAHTLLIHLSAANIGEPRTWVNVIAGAK